MRRFGLSYEEAGRAKRKGGLPESYETEALEPFKESLIQQISRLLQFFFAGSEYSKVDQVVLAGGCASIEGLGAMLEDQLGVPCAVANPLARMSLSPRVQAQSLAQDAPALMIAVDVIAVPLVRADWVVRVLALANTVGMTASGAVLLVAVRRARGAAALRGVWRALGAGLAGAIAGAAAGFGVTALLPVSGHWLNAAIAVLAGAAALAVFCAVVAVLDGGDLRSAVSRIARRVRPS